MDEFLYFVIFVDHFSKYIRLYPLKHKSDVFTIFSQFKRLVEKFFGLPIVSVYSDNGDEFIKLVPLFNAHGISHFTTSAHTPKHNGKAERRHKHIVEIGMLLLHSTPLSTSYWSYAFLTTIYLINQLPTPVLGNQSPFHILFKQSSNYEKLQPFGCLCFLWLRPYNTKKLAPKSRPYIFLGYSNTQSTYKCLYFITNRVYVSRHVRFIPNVFPSKELQLTDPSASQFSKLPQILFKSPCSTLQSVFAEDYSAAVTHSPTPTNSNATSISLELNIPHVLHYTNTSSTNSAKNSLDNSSYSLSTSL